MDVPQFIYSSVDGHLDCFHSLSIMYIHVQVFFFLNSVFSSFGYVPRSGIVGSYGNSIVNFSKNYQTVFHSDCIILHSYQHSMRVPISPHPL